MSLLEIGQKPIDNDNAKVKELEKKVNTNKSNITTLQGQFNDISQTVRTHTNIIAENQTNLRNSAKKNTANTFTQPQTFRNSVEFGTTIKAGFGASVVNITPEDNSSKTLNIERFDINMNNKKISNLANPTANNDAANKQYVDTKNTEQSNTINNQLNQIQGVMQQQGDNITTLSSSITSQGDRITALENNTINGKIKYNKTYIFLYERNMYAEYVNVGGFDITIFRHSISTYNDILYTNFFGYDRNWFVISGQMYNSNTVEIIVAKKAGTNYSYPIQVNVSRMERINPGEPIAEIQGEQ